MKRRCLDPDDKRWKDYGGRGITVDPSWLDFEIFLRDMGFAPDGKQIDRIDNDDGYYKGNCQWATLAGNSKATCARIAGSKEEVSVKHYHSGQER
jgi:hypothetical protein